MSYSPGSSSQSRTWLKAHIMKAWILFTLSVFSHARNSSNTAPSLLARDRVALILSSRESLYPWSFGCRDPAVISGRDLSPDVLATSVPVSGLSGKVNASLPKNEKTLLLRSSPHNISAIGGYTLFAVPIFFSDLMELLNGTQTDLRTRVSDESASSYQYNTTKWSFSVIVANTTLQYASFQAVVTRFIKLASKKATPDEIVSTRVGVLFNGSTPVAEINIMPCLIARNSSYVPFTGFGHNMNLSASQPTEIVKVTPFGSSCAYQFVNESTVLAPFQRYDLANTQNLTTRSLEAEMLVRIGQTAFDMSMRLYLRDDGLPVQVRVWVLKSLYHVALSEVGAMALLDILHRPLVLIFGNFYTDIYRDPHFNDGVGLDTGFYVLGQLMARLIIRITQKATSAVSKILSLNIWRTVLETLLMPLQAMSADADAWAMEGEIYGLTNEADESDGMGGDKDGKKSVVARWQVWVGDYEERDL